MQFQWCYEEQLFLVDVLNVSESNWAKKFVDFVVK